MPETVIKAMFNCTDAICHHLRNARGFHLLQTLPVTVTQFSYFH